METEIQKLTKEKNNAYWERNQLVAALSKLFPAWLGKHPKEDKEWEDDWKTIVFIEIPQKVQQTRKLDEKDISRQLSWHIHDSDIPLFDHLTYGKQYGNWQWDGHTTEEKYRRLRTIRPHYGN